MYPFLSPHLDNGTTAGKHAAPDKHLFCPTSVRAIDNGPRIPVEVGVCPGLPHSKRG